MAKAILSHDQLPSNFAARFWAKVKKGRRCWEWTASLSKKGYGQIAVFHNVPIHAHRASWILAKGEIPLRLWVLHKCDNPCCVRPSHLFLGTAADNAADMVEKGRAKNGCAIIRGERAAKAKLSPRKVIRIRALAADGHTQGRLAKQYKVRQSAIWCIVHRKSWAHI